MADWPFNPFFYGQPEPMPEPMIDPMALGLPMMPQMPPQMPAPTMPGPGVPSQHPDFAAMYGPGGSMIPQQAPPMMGAPQQVPQMPQAPPMQQGYPTPPPPQMGVATGSAGGGPEQSMPFQENPEAAEGFKRRMEQNLRDKRAAKKQEVADRKQMIGEKRTAKKAFRTEMKQLARISRMPKAAMNHMLKTREARVLQVLKDQGVEIDNVWEIRREIAKDAMKEAAEVKKQERELEKIDRRQEGYSELEEQRIEGRKGVKAAPGSPETADPLAGLKRQKEEKGLQKLELDIEALQKKIDSPGITPMAKRRMRMDMEMKQANLERIREATKGTRLRNEAEFGTGADTTDEFGWLLK